MSDARQQEIFDNSGWIGSVPPSTKRWEKPKETEPRSKGEAWKESDDWMGGAGAGGSPRRNSKPPIKIDGLRSSIKDNPFLKNNH